MLNEYICCFRPVGFNGTSISIGHDFMFARGLEQKEGGRRGEIPWPPPKGILKVLGWAERRMGCMHACMHGWMDGWMDGWTDGRMKRPAGLCGRWNPSLPPSPQSTGRAEYTFGVSPVVGQV